MRALSDQIIRRYCEAFAKSTAKGESQFLNPLTGSAGIVVRTRASSAQRYSGLQQRGQRSASAHDFCVTGAAVKPVFP